MERNHALYNTKKYVFTKFCILRNIRIFYSLHALHVFLGMAVIDERHIMILQLFHFLASNISVLLDSREWLLIIQSRE